MKGVKEHTTRHEANDQISGREIRNKNLKWHFVGQILLGLIHTQQTVSNISLGHTSTTSVRWIRLQKGMCSSVHLVHSIGLGMEFLIS